VAEGGEMVNDGKMKTMAKCEAVFVISDVSEG
jgi:hypothetical protein